MRLQIARQCFNASAIIGYTWIMSMKSSSLAWKRIAIAASWMTSPALGIIYAILLWRFVDKPNTRRHWWLSFVFGCMVHSVIDIFTHYNDGPVLFFPFNWHIRFHSPVSYWDRAHYADQFFWVELGINIVLFGYLFLPKLIQRFKKQPLN
jgi:hypothetical protein